MKNTILQLLAACLLTTCIFPQGFAQDSLSRKALDEVRETLVRQHGLTEKERIDRAVGQIAKAWKTSDGTEEDFQKFCTENFMSGAALSKNFARLTESLSLINGSLSVIRSHFNESNSFTDTEKLPVDDYLRGIVPTSDQSANKFSLFVQLNFPAYSEEERRENQYVWSREKFAMVTLGNSYSNPRRGRTSGENPYAKETVEFNRHIEHYFYRIDHVMDSKGNFLFPEGLLLHGHRGIRDVTKDEYTRERGFERQQVLNAVAEHMLDGTMPVQFLEDTNTRWNPFSNKLYTVLENGKLKEIKNFKTEDTRRYAGFLACVRSRMNADNPSDPQANQLQRTFQRATVSLEETEAILHRFLSDPLLKEAGKLVEKQLGRKLQPFDIWFSGFQEQAAYPSDFLDSLTKTRYPDPMALQNDLVNILIRMGFPEKDAELVGTHASVRPIVSGGYSSQPALPGGMALMTTMFGEDGLDYKSYRVAMHELGHTTCGVYCTTGMDYFILGGVPSGGITEGYAEMLAYKNAEGLGLYPYDKETGRHLRALAALWYLVEMGGQTLTEIRSWQWMYAHPEATAAEVQAGIMGVTEKVWNDYFAAIFGGKRNQHILSIYDHYIKGDLYLHNYFFSNVIMYQLYDAFNDSGLSAGLKKSAKEGATTTERWMRNAVGSGVSIEPLMKGAQQAVQYFQEYPLQKK